MRFYLTAKVTTISVWPILFYFILTQLSSFCTYTADKEQKIFTGQNVQIKQICSAVGYLSNNFKLDSLVFRFIWANLIRITLHRAFRLMPF